MLDVRRQHFGFCDTPMKKTREFLKATRFFVVSVRRQDVPWNTGGLIGNEMPPGKFVVFDPRLDSPDSDHAGVGLKACVLRGTSWVPVVHQGGRIEKDGRLCLFFGDDERQAFALGDEIKLVES
jgi:hypothetical protein